MRTIKTVIPTKVGIQPFNIDLSLPLVGSLSGRKKDSGQARMTEKLEYFRINDEMERKAFSDATKAFNQYAEDYDRWFDSPEGKALFRMEAEAVRLLLKDLEKPFLEIGVGTGRFAEELGIEFGIDPSAKALEIAERRGIKVEKTAGERLLFKDESFGAIFLLFTLCFVEDPEKVFAEAKRVLKKGGALIVGIINRESPWGQLYKKKKAENHPIYKHAHLYSVEEAAGMIEKAGMKIEKYSSTLYQQPSEMPYNEAARNGFIEGAGFVCILSREI